MKLAQLSYVAAIAERGSLRAAARHLGVAQPAFSRSIAELERELGAPLFERRAKGMVATPLGEAFAKRAAAILNDIERAKDEFAQLQGHAVGRVTVGLSIAAHLRLLPKALRPFRNRYPKVRLRIIEGLYPTLAPGLLDGSVDFYVGPDPGLKLPQTLRKEMVLSGERAVLCRIGHPMENVTSLKQLGGAEWITTSITPRAESELGDLFKRYRLPAPTVALQSQSALTLLTCLTNSDLLAMAPAQWTTSPIANRLLTTIPVKEQLFAAPIIAVTRSDVPLAPAAIALLDVLKRVAGQGAAEVRSARAS
ncbi:LysR substrate-binding domain-containing protein [Rhodoplanes sp. Z2-YC6860]|uniref:LysR substrate-binding domain-containing protein n=1 Tax=Rhodoplanes sp. Z2-YC6860 TaxID=674703 RepID=UPI00078E19CA|nr:LysR substrate-binding domain-containing protein [Rhodoplanes sp. Z2-YC6860]AMN44548.1 LysR family transcriptional regulator [Rhodoplanes sp. Z2-YC6860]